MAYRRRQQPITKICKKCGSTFEAWHIGRLYCGQACNMTAWRHRHKKKTKPTTEAKPATEGSIDFSLSNIAAIATGSLVADAASSLLSSEPSLQDLMDAFKVLTKGVAYNMGSITQRLDHIDDFHKALASEHPGLELKLHATRQRRLKEKNG